MIHPTAIIDSTATIGSETEIGPYSVIGANVIIGSNNKIESHVVIKGPTIIGDNNHILQYASLGEAPQDLKYAGEDTRLIIGDHNTIREFTTFNRGTATGNYETVIGNHGLFMAYVHIAHDCIIGDHVVFSNGAQLAGHVEVDDYAILSGFSLLHQFIRVGKYSFAGMGAALNRDLPPYTLVYGSPARAVCINKEGLKRHGFQPETIAALKIAFKALIKTKNKTKGLAKLTELREKHPEVAYFIDFCQSSKRGLSS